MISSLSLDDIAADDCPLEAAATCCCDETTTSSVTLFTNAFIFSLAGKPVYSGSSTPIRNANGRPLRPLPHGSNDELLDVRASKMLGGSAILSPSPWMEVACSFHPCANSIGWLSNRFFVCSLVEFPATTPPPLVCTDPFTTDFATFVAPNVLSTRLTHCTTLSTILAFRSIVIFFSRRRASALALAAEASRLALEEAARALREARERARADFWSLARRWAAISKSIATMVLCGK
mmetsp:Transcript_8420/g.13062  ORF Transcript_8420/g.13062 Transcript_8420/m.13062 type:complete len:235 (-) Transcript_8420:2-706(-)